MFNQPELKIPVDILLRMCYYVHAEFFFIAAERRMFSLRKLIFLFCGKPLPASGKAKLRFFFGALFFFLPKK